MPLIKEIAEAVQCVPNMLAVLQAPVRRHTSLLRAHHRDRAEDEIEGWKYIAPFEIRPRTTYLCSWIMGEPSAKNQPLPGKGCARTLVLQRLRHTDLDLQLKSMVSTIDRDWPTREYLHRSTVRYAGTRIRRHPSEDAIASYQWKMRATLESSPSMPRILSAADTIAALNTQLSVVEPVHDLLRFVQRRRRVRSSPRSARPMGPFGCRTDSRQTRHRLAEHPCQR